MAALDLTTFTEQDAGSKLTVTSAKADAVQVANNTEVFLYKDFGADYFDGFTLDFELQAAVGAQNTSYICIALSNTPDIAYDGFVNNEPIALIYKGSTVPSIFLKRGTGTGSTGYVGGNGTTYYCTLSRSAGSDDVYLYIYSNSIRTTLIATKTLSGYGTSTKWRYLYAFASANDAATATFSGFFQNFDLTVPTLVAMERDGILHGIDTYEIERPAILHGLDTYDIERDALLRGHTAQDIERDAILRGLSSLERDAILHALDTYDVERDALLRGHTAQDIERDVILLGQMGITREAILRGLTGINRDVILHGVTSLGHAAWGILTGQEGKDSGRDGILRGLTGINRDGILLAMPNREAWCILRGEEALSAWTTKRLSLLDTLNLRTTAVYRNPRDISTLQIVCGDHMTSKVPCTALDRDGYMHHISDRPMQLIDKVYADGEPVTYGYKKYAAYQDETGSRIACVIFDNPQYDKKISVTGKGAFRTDTATGELIENPADLIRLVFIDIQGYAVGSIDAGELARFYADGLAEEMKVAPVINNNKTTVKEFLDELAGNIHARWMISDGKSVMRYRWL